LKSKNRAQPLHLLVLAILALLSVRCSARSQAPVAVPAAVQPAETPTPAPAATPAAVLAADAPVAPSTEPAQPNSDAEPASENGAAAEEEPATGPQASQKEALDLCQSAAELIARGDSANAVAGLDRAYELMLTLPNDGDDFLQAKEDIRRLVADLLDRAYHPHGMRNKTASFDLAMPLVNNDHVRREIASFTGGERELFLEAYRRSGLYRPMILAKLEQAALPRQLAWLPLVESFFKVRALSRASALGLWQFIASTGLRYGLNRDLWIDERLDPEKSTDAAIAYLSELHASFGDWPKALAAYNCGEGRVQRLSTRSTGEFLDFWDLYEVLPLETRRYVPRFIAAVLILENPASYGITLPEPLTPPTGLAKVALDRPLDLERLDGVLGLPKGTLHELNPELRYGATPGRTHEITVPAAVQSVVQARASTLPEWKRPVPQYSSHRVRSGDTLGAIARRYGTTVERLMAANGLRRTSLLRIGQQLRIPPGRGLEGRSRAVR
jgi:membrane-bound lytic murein transglycosylase D